MELESLPVELLEMIVEAGIDDNDTSYLKSLRLVNKGFSQFHSVLSKLFQNIRLVADLELQARFTAEDLECSGFSTYVRHVTFVPPLHALVTFQDFIEIFEDQKKRQYGCYQPSGGSSGRRKNKTSSHARNLHSKKSLEEGYDKYYATALQSYTYLNDDGDVLDKWVLAMLAQMPKCTSFEFAAVDFNMIGEDYRPMFPKCIWSPKSDATEDGRWHADYDMAAVIADDFFKRVVGCLARTKCKIETLCFAQATTHAFQRWSEILEWKRLNLEHLRKLAVVPCIPEDYQQGRMHRLQADVEELCSRSASHLEVLVCRPGAICHMPGVAHTVLPRLRHLTIGPCLVNPIHLFSWLRKMDNLESIDFRGFVFLVERAWYEDRGWRELLDILRKLPSLMRGCLDLYNVKPKPDLNIIFDKSQDAMEFERLQTDGGRIALEKMIAFYLCSIVEWGEVRGSLHSEYARKA